MADDAQGTEDFDPPLRRALLRVHRLLAGPQGEHGVRLTRAVLLRSLGLVYLVAFLVAVVQLLPLLGSEGLTPIGAHLERVVAYYYGDRSTAMAEHPSLFWFDHGDASLQAVAVIGAVLALAVVLGVENGLVMLILWVRYSSIVNVGQRWYAFGWETQLLETGFIAVLWCPWTSLRPALRLWPSGDSPSPSPIPLWLYRWLIFRIMLGAGLIKLRGDPCWTELSCLDHHFETQPIPGPLSPWFHALPRPLLAAGVVFNHVADMVDGTHARSTGQCRNGGELLDHFTDPLSFSYWMIGLGFGAADPALALPAVLAIMATAVLTNIRAKITGEFTLAAFGPTEFKALLVGLGIALAITTASAPGLGVTVAWYAILTLGVVGVLYLLREVPRAVKIVNRRGPAPDVTPWKLGEEDTPPES
ncbi:MAG: lipase maturation factor family protein [Phycisphaerales bacterium]|nr:lipase maturation factor family protein [Phycisphaerales bacterium]